MTVACKRCAQPWPWPSTAICSSNEWLFGLLAFGVHLVLLGWLLLESHAAPRLLGYVLMVAGAAYVADTTAHTLLSNYVDYETAFVAIVAISSVIAEGWMALWLLRRGGKGKELVGV